MLVNIIQTFDTPGRRWFAGENPDVDPAIAAKWIADGKAAADVTPPQSSPVSTAAAGVYAPTGSADGDQTNFLDALNRAQIYGGGRYDFMPGTYLAPLPISGLERRLKSGMKLRSVVPGAARWVRTYSGAANSSNIFEALNVDDWEIDGFDLDGQRSDPLFAFTGNDAVNNGIRIANCTRWAVRNCKSSNNGNHGIIGVGRLSDFVIENYTATGNGYRSVHLHAEGNKINRRGVLRNIRSYRNGQSGVHEFIGQVTTTSGSGVVTLRPGTGAAFNAVFANTETPGCVFRIRGAGPSGGDLIDTVASVNLTNDATTGATFTISGGRTAGASLTGVPIFGVGSINSGMFVVYGGEDLKISDVQIWGEPGIGAGFSNYNEAPATLVLASVGDVDPYTATKFRLSATDYATVKAGFTAAAGAGVSLLISIDYVSTGLVELSNVTVTACNDADTSLTLATAVPLPLLNVRFSTYYASGSSYIYPSSRIKVDGLSVVNCGYGIAAEGGIQFSNTHVLDSVVDGVTITQCTDMAFSSTCSVKNSGVSNFVTRIGLDSAGLKFDGVLSGCGAANARIANTSSGKVLKGVVFNAAKIELSGQNPLFRATANFLGTRIDQAVEVTSNTTAGAVEGPKFLGCEIARNYGGGVSLSNTRFGTFQGCTIKDNTDLAAASGFMQIWSKGSAAKDVDVIGCDFRFSSATGNGSNNSPFVAPSNVAGSTGWRVLDNNFSTETRNGNTGSIVTLVAGDVTSIAAGNLFYASALMTATGGQQNTKFTPSVGASPYTYTNQSGLTQIIDVVGGTVSLIERSVDAGSTYTTLSGTAGEFVLPHRGLLRIAYTVAPTVTATQIGR